MQKYVCKLCGYIYDPAAGESDGDVKVAAGTAWGMCLRISYARSAVPVKRSSSRRDERNGGRSFRRCRCFFAAVFVEEIYETDEIDKVR